VVLLSVMAASSSDISGPPTMLVALPEANPSAYIGASSGLGTPVAILSIPLFMALADAFIGLEAAITDSSTTPPPEKPVR
ncbi:MAG: sodium-dependent bicarbonate transport family permease, partial [Pseudomonadota bacterium]